ncbi:hypothetical protein [Mycolicibacterium komossense]|uniref:PE-PGRS family protein n=1 Tax=Mycolicibacterium komossense TaxID=1779 RepID=A0ABT3CHT4_9MYCO|nr:hypothetical protein [Mycolicibacterium komossense]MCV7229086.1 hypothetical protein [Mycolicibacterium komossense]
MALDAPLNERQIEVLRWIRDGCPDGRWTDFTFKTTATALASRRLVTISKRGGVWSAGILGAGEHYLANSDYPAGHWAKRHARPTVDLDMRQPAVAHRPIMPPAGEIAQRPKRQPPCDEQTPTRKLVKDIVNAGGMLEIDTTDDNTSYKSLVGIINRRRMAPDGQEVILVQARYDRIVLRLSSVSDWVTDPPSQTVAAERIGRWHPAVATLRSDKRLDSLEKHLRGRAFRLLHALAQEAEARGHTVRLPKRSHHGSVEDPSKLGGDLIFKVEGIECSVNIWQPKDRLPHTPTQEEIEREKKYGWGPSRYDYVPADRLSMLINTNSRFSSKITWPETKTLALHSRLPDAIMSFERWAVIDAEGNEAERRAETERRVRREREDELARQAYVQHAFGEQLVADLADWDLSLKLRRYLAAMAGRVEDISDDGEREAATMWLNWCRAYAAKRNPLEKPICQPKVKAPGYSEIQEFRNRLGFQSSLW